MIYEEKVSKVRNQVLSWHIEEEPPDISGLFQMEKDHPIWINEDYWLSIWREGFSPPPEWGQTIYSTAGEYFNLR